MCLVTLEYLDNHENVHKFLCQPTWIIKLNVSSIDNYFLTDYFIDVTKVVTIYPHVH